MVSPPTPYSESALEDVRVLGVGASGLTRSVSTVTSTGAGDFSSVAGGVSGIRGVSEAMVLQQKRTSADKIKAHLSHCRPGEGAGLAATNFTLLYGRTGVTGPLVMAPLVLRFTVPSLQSWDYRTKPLARTTHALRKNCYNAAR